jgi:small subunit ribosomal protein S15
MKTMALPSEKKKTIIQGFHKHESDTGSTEVQVALLTGRIKELTQHMNENKHDFSSKRGLLKLVAERKKLLKYLMRTNPSSYAKVIQKLNLKNNT